MTERKYAQECGGISYWVELSWKADVLGAGKTAVIDFIVKEIFAFEDEAPILANLMDDGEETVIIHGTLKWDGCTHIYGPGDEKGMGHFCDGFVSFIELLKHLDEVRAELTGWDAT